jgi:undecaprenyl pyrophosphate phosphatase UppP
MGSKQEQDWKKAAKYIWIACVITALIGSALPESFPTDLVAVFRVLFFSAVFCTWRWWWWVRNRHKAELLAEAMRQGNRKDVGSTDLLP